MADIAPGLNFRIGADVKGVQKAIKEAEKSFRGAVSSFSSIGNSLSLALSAPLAGFTGISIKAAGEIESLRLALEKTMQGSGRSIEEARIELEELRKAALAPGLDFQQAVKGSIRLQGVGFSAEKARKIIAELANALTLAGGTADQLDGVTKQFAQMVGKGKIMQEDLTIILENMPNLAKVMQDTFGTSNAEMLRKMGVSVEDFIGKLTEGMAKLPRAQGGIANAIVNAQNAIKLAIAEVGEEINKTFNITGALESFAQWVGGLAKWFRELDDSTKRAIGAAAVFVATIGPAFKVMQAGVFVVGKLQAAFLMFQKALAMSVTEGGIPTFIAWWKKLDLAMKTSIIGATVAVVLALGAAWYATSKDMSAAAQAARRVEETRKAALDSVGAEIAEIQALTNVAKDETKSKSERMAAMKRLIDISPDYQRALDGEKINTDALTSSTSALVASLIRSANARKAAEDIAEIDKQMRNLSESSQPSIWQSAGNAFLAFGNQATAAALNAKTFAENMAENKAVLEAQRAELVKFLEANIATADGIKTTAKATAGATEENEKYAETLSDIANVSAQHDLLGSEKIVEQAKAIEGGIKKLLDFGFKPASKEVQGLKTQLQGLFSGIKMPNLAQLPTLAMPESLASIKNPYEGIAQSVMFATSAMQQNLTVAGQAAAIYAGIRAGTDGLSASMQSLAQSMIQNGDLIGGIMITLGDSITQAGAKGAASLADFAKAALASAAKVIRAWIQMAVTRAALSALQSIPFPFNIAAAAAAGGIVAVLFNAAIKKIGIPALAEGGVLTSPRLVMAGEYPGARTNPEIVTPENKMRDVVGEMLQRFGGAGGGMGNGQIIAKISGDDIYFLWQKAERKAQRLR